MNESKATRYQRLRRRAQLSAWGLAALALGVLAFTPLGRWLYEGSAAAAVASSLPAPGALAFVLFITLVVLSCGVVASPAVWHRSTRIDPAYGRADGSVLRQWILGGLLAIPVALVAGGVVWASGSLAGRGWWLLAGVTLSAALVLAVRSGPAILARAVPVRPLNRPALASRIADLARRAGVPVAAIQELVVDDASGTVAMVAGIGPGRRVLVASDVARNWSDDEVAVVVAHELAHHVHHDLLRALGLNTLVLCAGLWAADAAVGLVGPVLGLAGVADPAALPVVAFVACSVWLAATPFRHAQSRRQERRADRFALAWTGQASAFAAAVRRASARHLVEDRPSVFVRWLYHRHPPASERIELAEAHRHTSDRRRPV